MPADPADPPRSTVSRRGLIAGAGAAVLASSLVAVPHADAEPAHRGDGVGPAAVHPDGAPITTTVGSAPISGYVYRTACMYDFRVFDPTALLTWGGQGVYSAKASTPLRATFDVPPGCLARDIEWYVYNTSGEQVFGFLYQYAPGSGTISPMATTVIPAGNSKIFATRVAVGTDTNGPFPLGFSQGAGTTALLPTPIRAYDSRSSGGALSSAETRTITLPASALPVGASAALVNVTAVGGTAGGYLKVYAADASVPAASTLNFGTAAIANALTVGVSSGRQLKVFASQTVNVIVDVTGYVA
jgi:hypothetical protein